MGALIVFTGVDASAAGPATRPEGGAGMRVQLPDGERGTVLRVDEQTLVIRPIPGQRMVRMERPTTGVGTTAPSPEEEAAAESVPAAEKTFTLGAATTVATGVVTGERMTVTGDVVRSMEFENGTVADIKPGFEVFVTATEDGAAKRIMVMPVPIFEPRGERRTGAAGATTRRAGRPTTRGAAGFGPLMGGGIRGKVVKADEKSITILPTEGEGVAANDPAKPQRERTFQLAERTRILAPTEQGEKPGRDGGAATRISFVSADASALRPGQDVTITPDPADDAVARRIMIVPDGFGQRRVGPGAATRPLTDRPPTGRAATSRPATSRASG